MADLAFALPLSLTCATSQTALRRLSAIHGNRLSQFASRASPSVWSAGRTTRHGSDEVFVRQAVRMQEQVDADDIDDMPSDTYVPAGEAQGVNEEQMSAKRSALINRLLQLCAVTARGKLATDGQTSIVEDLVMQLEEVNPTPQPVDTDLIDGYWTLVYYSGSEGSGVTMSGSSSTPSIPPVVKTAAKILLSPVLQFGQVRQRVSVSDGTITSELDVTAFPATSATVKTSSRCTPVGGERLEVVVEKTTVTGGKLVDAIDLGGLSFDLPIEQIASRLRNSAPETYFDTFYLDDKLRISRAKDGKLFVYTRLD